MIAGSAGEIHAGFIAKKTEPQIAAGPVFIS